MKKDNEIHYYYFFSEPIKKEYVVGDEREPVYTFQVEDVILKLYLDDDKKIEMLRIEILNPKKDSNFISTHLKHYTQSLLRITYSKDFKFSRFVSRMIGDFNNGEEKPHMKSGLIKVETELKEPVFDEKLFRVCMHKFSQKPLQLELFTISMDDIDNPIDSFANLYKIIEFEYHLSNEKDKTKPALKKSRFQNVISNFSFEDKKGDELIDYIVDLRHKCNHLKKDGKRGKYGFTISNINEKKELQKFLPTFRKICAQVIDAGFEVL